MIIEATADQQKLQRKKKAKEPKPKPKTKPFSMSRSYISVNEINIDGPS